MPHDAAHSKVSFHEPSQLKPSLSNPLQSQKTGPAISYKLFGHDGSYPKSSASKPAHSKASVSPVYSKSKGLVKPSSSCLSSSLIGSHRASSLPLSSSIYRSSSVDYSSVVASSSSIASSSVGSSSDAASSSVVVSSSVLASSSIKALSSISSSVLLSSSITSSSLSSSVVASSPPWRLLRRVRRAFQAPSLFHLRSLHPSSPALY